MSTTRKARRGTRANYVAKTSAEHRQIEILDKVGKKIRPVKEQIDTALDRTMQHPPLECSAPTPGKPFPFQEDLVQEVIQAAKQHVSMELATGSGKTTWITPMTAHHYLGVGGKVVYISPNAASIGDLTQGAIAAWTERLTNYRLGSLNEFAMNLDAVFLTPARLCRLRRTKKGLLRRFLDQTSCIIIDEAHRFPDDNDKVMFGHVCDIARRYMKRNPAGKVVSVTGTWHRLDGAAIMGACAPDVLFTVLDSQREGRCPDIYGIQVILNVKGTLKKHRNHYSIQHFSKAGQDKYWGDIASSVHHTWKRTRVPFAVFVSRVEEAERVASIFNEKSPSKPMAVYVGRVDTVSRLEIIEAIRNGKYAGYVTCTAGAEAIDIPELGVVHLVRRTSSIQLNMQSVGRALRMLEGKRAIVVDYQLQLEGLKDYFTGASRMVTLDDLGDAFEGRDTPSDYDLDDEPRHGTVANEDAAEPNHVPVTGADGAKRQRFSGGKLVGRDTAEYVGMTLEEERLYLAPRTITDGSASYEECSAWALSNKVKDQREWHSLYRAGKLPSGFPCKPDEKFKGSGWLTWGMFLRNEGDTPTAHYEECSAWAQENNVTTCTEWFALYTAGKLPKGFPRGPDSTFAGSGWVDWYTFLGRVKVGKLTFRQVQAWAKSSGICGRREWHAAYKSGRLPPGFPCAPNTVYPEFPGWLRFLSRETRTLEQSMLWARSSGITSSTAWCDAARDGRLPGGIPSRPDKTYSGFPGWRAFLGTV